LSTPDEQNHCIHRWRQHGHRIDRLAAACGVARRNRVSSKGGTTAAGTRQLDEAHTQEAMVAAVRAAFTRAGELGSQP